VEKWFTLALFVMAGISVGIASGNPWYGVATTLVMSAAAHFLVKNLQLALSLQANNQRVFAERLERKLDAVAAAITREKS
jgi:hypothetical protein